VKCFFDEEEARGTCRFCGRAVCAAHGASRMPYIASVFVGARNTPKAVVINDALWCGTCKPEPHPLAMPEIF
jgi:hypothetical protein